MSYVRDQFNRFIQRDLIRTIFEVGSRDANDAIALADYYKPTKIYVFEPNPACLNLCRTNIGNHADIELIEAAVSETTGTIKFFPVIESYQPGRVPTFNIGASSLLKSSGLYGEEYIQGEIDVVSKRLDDFCASKNLDRVDLICMDVQGAEIQVLKSLGTFLETTSYIITEATIVNQYSGQAQLHHINDFLVKAGFYLVSIDMAYWGFGNFLYVNSKVPIPVVGS